MKAGLSVIFLLILVLLSNAQQKKLASYINPFIGASTNIEKAGAEHGLGKTFPGATTPFGMVQVSPNTITGGDNGSGYSYEHTTIEGFAFTQMSGIGWYGDLGNFLVMPTTGPLKTSSGRIENPEEGYRSLYSKTDEIAKAGYYAATLTDYKIRTECTAAPHSGILRFTFPENNQSRIQIDLARRVGGTSTEQYVKVVDEFTIEGWMKCTPDGGGWGNGDGKANYTVYFYAQFSKPLKDFGIWIANIPDNQKRKRQEIESDSYQQLVANATIEKGSLEKQGKHLGFYSEFKTTKNEKVFLKSGISFVNIEGAKNNLLSEIKDFDFNRVKENATKLWNDALSKMIVEGKNEADKTIFYTALYHSMIDPRCFTDVDGSYPGGDGKIQKTNKFVKRTIFSGWDVFRSQFPLQTIINPTMVSDMINSLVELADENKTQYLERWELMNAYSGCMIGNPAIPVIVDAYNKGIRTFDVNKSYFFAKNTSEKFGNSNAGFSKSISLTLEYAYTDWCMSVFADSLGKKEDAAKYLMRSKYYQNTFDTSVQWFRPHKNDGTWENWPIKGRLTQSFGSLESNPYQQGWFVPHDLPGLFSLMGGKEKALSDLIDMFTKTPENMMWNDYYNHANEPVHHVPFLFNRLEAPWLTQYWSRQICKKAYHNSVEGLVGNEDVGQMSAWYILASSGLHPICPGDNRYEITSPLFDQITITLDTKYYSGRKFVIKTNNNSVKNVYIQRAALNGFPLNKSWLHHQDIVRGGKLELWMGPQPNKNWGADASEIKKVVTK